MTPFFRKIRIVVVMGVTSLLGPGVVFLSYIKTRDSPPDKSTGDISSGDISSGDKSSGDNSFGIYGKWAVATDTPNCSKIGNEILKANGSAVDAAIAAMFCLGVVSMHSSGIGGGGVMLVYNQTLKKATVIDFRETAPATADENMFKKKAKKGH